MLKNGSAYKEIFRLKKGDTIPVFYGKDKQLYRINPDALNSGLDARLTILENNEYKVTYFEVIDASAGTSGSFPLPTNTTLYENGWEGNAFLSTLNGDTYPEGKTPKESNGALISANITVLGGTVSWVSTNTYTDPIGLVYQLTVLGKDLNNLDIDNVLDFYNTDNKYDNLVVFCEEYLGTGADTVFNINGSIENATFVEGSWDLSNWRAIPASVSRTDGAAIYDDVIGNVETRSKITISSFNPFTGDFTLSGAPISGQVFCIWYWYELTDTDDLGNTYYRIDVTSTAEAGQQQLDALMANRPTALNIDLINSDPNAVRAVVGGRTSWTITHLFNTRDLRVEIMALGGNYDTQFLNIKRPTVNTVVVEAMGNIADNSFRASIKV